MMREILNKNMYWAIAGIFLLTAVSTDAREWVGAGKKKASSSASSLAAGCAPASSATELNINNTRALIQTGGDMWWDFQAAQYEIPRGSGRTALFAGSLWLGGKDVSGQLKVAALRFRQVGNDYWTGPLSTTNAEIDAETCAEYDKHYVTTRSEVEQFVAWYELGLEDAANGTNKQRDNFPDYDIPKIILEWPAHGRNFPPYDEDFYLAPFNDRNGDGIYNPLDGDYPGYDLKGEVDCRERIVNIYGDQNLWWIFNDKGNVHTETGAQSIGMEIRAQAFAFATNDEVNNMTFYNYELVNRSTFTLTDTYFGVWVDADLGCSQDDFVGCDVQRGLGFAYNGDENDEDCQGATGYGNLPPAIGVDFFQGPFQDNDGIDNPGPATNNEADALPFDIADSDDGIPYKGLGVGYGDGIIDNERFGMSRFLYHNNNQTVTGDPRTGVEYYNYLRSIWRDGSGMVYGGTGHSGSVTAPYIDAKFMFPDETDVVGWGTGGVPQAKWTEVTESNTPADRRFMQSAGPFTLEPGAVNNITFGVVWARTKSGNAEASVFAMKKADTKTQALFDNCFRVLNGPDAPDLTIQELDKELILYIDNKEFSNNFGEQYAEVDPSIIPPDSLNGAPITAQQQFDYQAYKFQGYQIYQVKDNTVSASDLGDIDLARLVAQCDIIDSVSKIVNFNFDDQIGATVPVVEVDGANEGIKHSFQILTDQFAEGDNRLVNHKSYYFIAIAYAYNNYIPFDPTSDDSQNEPYIGSRKGSTGPIRPVTGIPHDVSVENGGTILNSMYGDGVEITRIEGRGNGGNALDLTDETIAAILESSDSKAKELTYKAGFGPVNIKVVDPLNVKPGTFSLRFLDTLTNGDLTDAAWEVFGTGIDTVKSPNTIEVETEHLIPDLGISVSIGQSRSPGHLDAVNNGFISGEGIFENPEQPWLIGLPDGETQSGFNWILSGTQTDDNNPDWDDWKEEWTNSGGTRLVYYYDEQEVYENILGGTVAPFFLTAQSTGHGPKPEDPGHEYIYQLLGNSHPGDTSVFNLLNNVDIVFTSDKSLWSRCPVLEMRDTVGESQGGAMKGRLRETWSVDKDGNVDTTSSLTDPDASNYIAKRGMGWFPGYAIDVETGERLNVAFGEDSYFIKENGRDMIFNPTGTFTEGPAGNFRGGGKHYVFVFRNNDVEDDRNAFPLEFDDPEHRMPAYDAGAFIAERLQTNTNVSVRDVYRACAWTIFAMGNPAIPMLSVEEGLVPSKLTVKLRVAKEYEAYGTQDALSEGDALTVGDDYYVQFGPVEHDGVTYERGQHFTAKTAGFVTPGSDKNDVLVPTVNSGLPLYNFDLTDLAALTDQDTIFTDALGKINVVPNPYYAYSQYESDKLDTRIRITNLPQKCSVRIYTVNGILVRTFEKDDPTITSLDWDLKNQSRTPIGSGVYLIHVDVPDVGQRVLKWFGILRPIDLDNF